MAGQTSLIFESPVGQIVVTRQFTPGAVLRVGGQMSGWTWSPVSIVKVELIPEHDEFYLQTQESSIRFWDGAWWLDFTLPYVTARAIVRVSASTRDFDTIEMPIAIGNIIPERPPGPPSDEGPLGQWKTPLIIAGIAVVGLLLVPELKRLFKK